MTLRDPQNGWNLGKCAYEQLSTVDNDIDIVIANSSVIEWNSPGKS